MAKVDYKASAKKVLEEVGGKENIDHIAHCATRLRLNLKIEDNVNDDNLKEIEGIIGVTRAGGQIQLIVGQEVTYLYEEVKQLAEFTDGDQTSQKTESKESSFSVKKVGAKILDGLSGSLTPAIPLIIVAAFFKLIEAVIGPEMLGWASETSDLYVLAQFVGDTTFYFFPIIIGYTSAKKFNASPLMGIFLGSIMLHPTFSQLAEEGSAFSVYGIPTLVQDYSNTLLPIILSVWIMSYVERYFNDTIPGAFKSILAPSLTIVVMLPITLSVLGPAGAILGRSISEGLLGLEGVVGFIGVALVGALFQLLVLTGMHIILIASLIEAFLANGSESFVAPGLAAASFAVGGMCLGAALKLRNKDEKSLAWGYFISMIVAGVSEPGLYGIGIRYKKPMIGMITGGFAGGLYLGIMNSGHFNLIPLTNLLSLLAFTGHTTANLIHGIIGCLIAFGVAALMTYFLTNTKESSPSAKEEMVK
ncbi:PTS system IIB component, Glc family /PTS system IIC component, Glc family [Pelagirhabdus alkalitolerans]|uniref:PTS system IIB component, Glc family /PTS system IIC component, Glc family n=1 Tax=Pelagirhabdus alkalitolerans TaxID=1612202 RepID=A0A1G6GNC3_9BACI|nr:PTS transporter subunit EIIC [Pelagirhabdus alkalitolerans]SDB83458.1 PTS system IIB component, Glc family /PTS system IIC component, Glc family [Pelagirhabdus alkalitolerans]